MAWTDPLRLEIQKRLTAILEEITPGNGYILDFSAAPTKRVFRGRAVFGDNDPIPMLSILEAPIPIDQLPAPRDSGMSSGGWELVIQGFFKDDKDNPTDEAHIGLADVKKRLGVEMKKARNLDHPDDGILALGNDVVKMQIGPGVVRPPDEISAKAYFWLNLQLELAEDLTDPYGITT